MAGTKLDNTLRARTADGAYKRPNFRTDFKRQLVEESFEPGASVALIARQNDINANLLFKWRRQYLEGAYGLPTLPEHAKPTSDCEATPLLPVNIVADAATEPAATPNASESLSNVFEIEFERACLRIRGEVSPDTLRLLIRELSR
ncbi:transposase [Paraburkholderia sp. CNPSo 3157]|uniref:Transposase n=2 Tax=Paraburkholderia franconis TaxID=2654983 RepID=A0A7X1NJS9_9BURK|nr:transposase [Paraburkholderia franconis]